MYKKDQGQRSIRDLRFKSRSRHVLLYEHTVLFCKKKDDALIASNSDKTATYTLKNSLLIASCALTEMVKGDKRKFELWSLDKSESFTLQAGSVEVKSAWVTDIRSLLSKQTDPVKEKLMDANILSNGTIPQHCDNVAVVATADDDDDNDNADNDIFMTSSQQQDNISGSSVSDLQQVFISQSPDVC